MAATAFVAPPAPLSVSRLFPARLAAALLAALSLAPLPALAQATAPPKPGAPAKPASMELMNDMALAAAVNVCELAVDAKVPVQTSVLSTAKAITYVVTSRYGSQIGNPTRLQPEQIANGTIIQTVGRVKQGCYAKLNATDKKFVDDVISDFEKQVKAQGQKK